MKSDSDNSNKHLAHKLMKRQSTPENLPKVMKKQRSSFDIPVPGTSFQDMLVKFTRNKTLRVCLGEY